jgi:hypothetical protein
MDPKNLILVFLLFLKSFPIASQTNITFQISAKQVWDIPSSGGCLFSFQK